MQEVWKEYKTYDRWSNLVTWLRISNLGNIDGKLFNREEFTEDMIINAGGYLCIVNKHHPIHVLVDEVFRGKKEKGQHLHHINKIKTDNRLSNLLRVAPSKHAEIHANSQSEEQRKKNSDANKKRWEENFNELNEIFQKSIHTPEADIKRMESMKITNSTEETKLKRSEAASGKNNGMYNNHSLMYNNGKITKRFDSYEEAKAEGFIYLGNVQKFHWYTNGIEEIRSSNTCPEGWHQGRIKGQIPWNKGLTKETDERVAKYGETQSENKKNNVNSQHSSTKDLSASSRLNPLF